MPNSDQRPKVTIEDLLRLKRSERPGAEFWANFDRELRQKQLTALIEKRPWWHGVPQLLTRRTYLPIGATAILAFTFVSVRYYTPQQVAQVDVGTTSAPASFNQPVAVALAQVSSPLVNRHEQVAPAIDDRTAVAASEQTSIAPASDAPALPATTQASDRPSARSIAANLARLEQSEPELINAVMGSRLSTPARAQAAVMSSTELVSLTNNSSKRSRILAQYNDRSPLPEPATPENVRERLSRRLGDTEFIERFNRIGLKGDQVSLGLTLRL